MKINLQTLIKVYGMVGRYPFGEKLPHYILTHLHNMGEIAMKGTPEQRHRSYLNVGNRS